MKPLFNHITKLLLALTLLATWACSTTSRLEEGDVLYTGVKKLNYVQDSVKINSDVKDQIFDVINVKPNNPLYSPYYRTPFPIGLWVYNHWDPNAKGLKGWLYKHLVAQPVLISRVRPQTRVEMINTLLRNNGYFSSSANYELNYNKKNPKKASITYNVKVNEPYVFGDIKYLEKDNPMASIIDSCARANTYFKTGNRYCLDSLNQVRIDITNTLRNRGYYYYMPEYLEYLADSVTTPGVIHMQLVENANIPNSARTRYLMNNVTVVVDNHDLGGKPDTVRLEKADIIRMEPVHVRNSVIHDNLVVRKGRPFRVGNMDRTQYMLSRTGIFSNIDMQVEPVPDSITPSGDGLMNLNIFTMLDKPIEAKIEVQGVSKSNSFIGPGLNLSLSHKNLFGGGERLTGDLTMSYEWQTGKGGTYNDKDLNSYEFGANIELAFPRLLAPRFVDRSRRFQNWTRISLHGNIMNRPGFFKMVQAGGSFTWEWHTNRHSMHSFTPFKLTYSELLNTTTAFDSTLFFNPALAQSFKDMFIPEMRYTYTYDNQWGNDALNWTATVIEAGNVFAGIWALAGKHDEKLMFNTTFSQFVKAQTQLVWKHYFSNDFCLASRLFLGAAYAYGNMDELPYREQFYIGGANSIRAFTVRTVGPGSYNPLIYKDWEKLKNIIAYYDQVGDFKFETNFELRFPIISILKGAVFVDAGNIWLLKEDEYREGGKFKFKNFFKELAVGTGLGVRLDISMLVVRADLGIGLHLPYDTGKKGYFNIPKFKDSLAFHLAIGYPF